MHTLCPACFSECCGERTLCRAVQPHTLDTNTLHAGTMMATKVVFSDSQVSMTRPSSKIASKERRDAAVTTLAWNSGVCDGVGSSHQHRHSEASKELPFVSWVAVSAASTHLAKVVRVCQPQTSKAADDLCQASDTA